jgi:hypothetical protein
MGRRYLSTIREAGLEPRSGLTIDDDDLMARAIKEVGRGYADDTGTEDKNFHGAAPYRAVLVPTRLVPVGLGDVMIGS